MNHVTCRPINSAQLSFQRLRLIQITKLIYPSCFSSVRYFCWDNPFVRPARPSLVSLVEYCSPRDLQPKPRCASFPFPRTARPFFFFSLNSGIPARSVSRSFAKTLSKEFPFLPPFGVAYEGSEYPFGFFFFFLNWVPSFARLSRNTSVVALLLFPSNGIPFINSAVRPLSDARPFPWPCRTDPDS